MTRPRWWARVEQAPVFQLAVAWGGAVVFAWLDPHTPHAWYFITAFGLLVAGATLKLVARLGDNMRREWPLHIELAGNAFCAAAFLLLAVRSGGFTRTWQELAEVYWLYGGLAVIFLIRGWVVRRAIRQLRKGP